MNESQLDPMDRKTTAAPRRAISPVLGWTLAALLGFFAAFSANEFFTTGERWQAFSAVFNGLMAAVLVWDLLRSPTPAPRRNISPVLGWTFAALLGFVAAIFANKFFTTGEQLEANWAVMFGLMAAVSVWDLLRPRRAD